MKLLANESKLLIQKYIDKNIKTAQSKVKSFLSLSAKNNNSQVQFDKTTSSFYVSLYNYRIYLSLIDEQICKIVKFDQYGNEQQYDDFDTIHKIVNKLKLRDSIFSKILSNDNVQWKKIQSKLLIDILLKYGIS